MDQERLILVFAEHLVEKLVAGVTLLLDHAAHAAAGVDDQTQRKGKIGFLREISNGLGMAVFFDAEIVLGEVADDDALLVADGGKDVNNADVGRKRLVGFFLLSVQRGAGGQGEKETTP